MEDFIKFIFIAFVVISFFRKFFKAPKPPADANKVKLPERESNSSHYPHQPQESVAKKPEVDDYEILREIEKMFKMGSEKESPLPDKNPRTQYQTKIEEHSQKKNETIQDSSEKTMKVQTIGSTMKVQTMDTSFTSSEHSISDYKRKKAKKETDDLALAFEKNLASNKAEAWGLFNMNLRNKLRQPQSLKDYIIISEILGKPKAFD